MARRSPNIPACLLNGRTPPGDCYGPERLQPAPLAVFDDFLTEDERDHFWRLALDSEGEFFEAGYAGKEGRMLDRRRRMGGVLELDAPDRNLFDAKLRPLLEGLPSLFSMPAIPAKKIEVKMTSHSHGGFFGIHQDAFHDIDGSERHLSWVYYFHQRPKPYAGGDLILFDSNRVRENHRFDDGKFTRYIPADNQLVFFPSCFYHGVTPVESPLPDFKRNRFAISGHVRF